jgi:hypothetical protein
MPWRCTRAHQASNDGAWERSHHEELAEKALTQSLPRGLSVARFTLAALGATTIEAAERCCLEWSEAVSGSPQWDPTPSTVPVDTRIGQCFMILFATVHFSSSCSSFGRRSPPGTIIHSVFRLSGILIPCHSIPRSLSWLARMALESPRCSKQWLWRSASIRKAVRGISALAREHRTPSCTNTYASADPPDASATASFSGPKAISIWLQKLNGSTARGVALASSTHTAAGRSMSNRMVNRSWHCLAAGSRGDGLYLVDEPEAALSPMRQLSLLCLLHDLVKRGAQFIIASHSPILLAFPQARIYLLLDDRIEETEYTRTEHYALTKSFLNDHRAMLKRLFKDAV